MSFLAPLYLLGFAALSLPVVLHMLRRDTSRRVQFSSLMMLEQTPILIRRRSRLQDILLLLLRCLALAALAFAFARPLMMQLLPGASQQIGRRVVVLVDTSASMRRASVWDAARAELDEVLSNITPDDRATVYAFDRTTREVEDPSTLAPTWHATQLGAALATALDAARGDETETAAERAIILISDMQQGADVSAAAGLDWPADVALDLRTIAADAPTNAGLHAIAAPDTAVDADLSPRLRVLSAPGSRAGQFAVQWVDAEGRPVGDSVETYVPPGGGAVLHAPPLPESVAEPRLVLTGDDHAFDNTVYITPPTPRRVNIAYLGDDDPADTRGLRFFLENAFQPTRTLVPTFVDLTASAKLIFTAGRFDPALQTHLDNGATVVYLMTDAPSAEGLRQLLDMPDLAARDADDDRHAILGRADLNHPLLAVFANPRYSDFTQIHFWHHRTLDAALPTDAHIVAAFDNGNPAIIDIPRGKGRVIVMTSTWRPDDSQLALSSKFVPLMYSLLELSGAAGSERRAYYVGDRIDLPPNATALRGPDGATLDDHVAQQPGVHTIATGDGDLHVAVNLPPDESRTAVMDAHRIESLGAPGNAAQQRAAAETTLGRPEIESRQQYWRWCVLAVLGVLLVETALAGRAGHQVYESREPTT